MYIYNIYKNEKGQFNIRTEGKVCHLYWTGPNLDSFVWEDDDKIWSGTQDEAIKYVNNLYENTPPSWVFEKYKVVRHKYSLKERVEMFGEFETMKWFRDKNADTETWCRHSSDGSKILSVTNTEVKVTEISFQTVPMPGMGPI